MTTFRDVRLSDLGAAVGIYGYTCWLDTATVFCLKYKVNAHAKANTGQNCSFDAVITILFRSLFTQSDAGYARGGHRRFVAFVDPNQADLPLSNYVCKT